ncbi:hypothetical protein E2320_022092 [Naja naja]|nr:hypothetical protein E2320_022092 [Naja naja]
MALMGIQLVFSLLVASIFQKMAPHWSFARWLLCNGSRRINGVTDGKPSTVPRDIDLQLESSPIRTVDALGKCVEVGLP